MEEAGDDPDPGNVVDTGDIVDMGGVADVNDVIDLVEDDMLPSMELEPVLIENVSE